MARARKHLIIGAGPAALSALEAIRRNTTIDQVKLVSMEDCPPYSPASLSYLLSGRISVGQLWTKGEGYFRDLETTLVTGREVVGVVPGEKRVVYHDGSSEIYDTLLIASGAGPVNPLAGTKTGMRAMDFRTLADCRRVLGKLKGRKDVAIIGGGLVGIKIAIALIEKGYPVSIIEKEQDMLPLYFNREAAAYIRDAFIAHKARIFSGTTIAAVKRTDGKSRIELSDGGALEADILVNAAGVKSRASFLQGTGIKMNKGIVVDRRMRSSVDGIFAAGDVAEAPGFFSDGPGMNAIVPNAVSGGGVAGANMAGGQAEYEGGIPMAALNLFGNTAFSIGLIAAQDGHSRILEQKDGSRRKFKRFVFQGEKLVGGVFVNEVVDPGTLSYLIKNRIDMSPHMEALFERTRPLSDPWLSSFRFR